LGAKALGMSMLALFYLGDRDRVGGERDGKRLAQTEFLRWVRDDVTVAQQIHVINAVGACDHAAISARIFAVAFAPPRAAMRSRSVSNVANPHRVANAMTGAGPAQDTRFGSSNRTEIARRA
jgi:hypothetical protein